MNGACVKLRLVNAFVEDSEVTEINITLKHSANAFITHLLGLIVLQARETSCMFFESCKSILEKCKMSLAPFRR